MVPAKLAHV